MLQASSMIATTISIPIIMLSLLIFISCNNLNVQLLVNNSATHTKKRHINKTEKKTSEALKINITKEKKVLIQRFRMKNSKTSIHFLLQILQANYLPEI